MVLVDTEFKRMNVDIKMLIQGNYGALAGMITMAALIGKTTFPQMYVLVMLEMIFYTLDRIIITDTMKAVDAAGSMTIHMFGAYFGLTASFFFKPRRAILDEYEQGKPSYNSRLIAMIGTLFLFVYFPTFNSALSVGVAQQRAAVNTFYAMTSSALTAGFISRCSRGGKLDMEVIMNASLAGGVMIAASVEMIFNPGFAMIVGGFAGISSGLAYIKLTPFC